MLMDQRYCIVVEKEMPCEACTMKLGRVRGIVTFRVWR